MKKTILFLTFGLLFNTAVLADKCNQEDTGTLIMSKSYNNAQLEQFDDLFIGDPVDIEKNMSALLPQANSLENKSIYLQKLSQIALAQAMQQKFDLAHKTLDTAEAGLTPEYELARVRVLLERGRVFHQADNLNAALPLFKQSYELSKKCNFDFHTINAAHMVAIIENKFNDKIKWNKIAIELAEKTEDKRGQAWLGALYNNLAQNYIESEQYQQAYSAFEQSKKFGEERKDAIIVRGSKWGIARALRSLNRLDEALNMQVALLEEYEELNKKGEFPIELLQLSRGVVYEELAEIYLTKAKIYAALAYQDLHANPWCIKLMSERLDKMKQLKD